MSSPLVSSVKNSPVATIAINAPTDIFRVIICVPLNVSNPMSQVLINIIVHENNTTTLPKCEKQNSALSKIKKKDTVELIHTNQLSQVC
jgi:hypothetical protein